MDDADMTEIRCASCNRKLADAEYQRLTIKCPRCGCLNSFRAGHRALPPERPERQNHRGIDHGHSDSRAE